jgi:hypothetical protein
MTTGTFLLAQALGEYAGRWQIRQFAHDMFHIFADNWLIMAAVVFGLGLLLMYLRR